MMDRNKAKFSRMNNDMTSRLSEFVTSKDFFEEVYIMIFDADKFVIRVTGASIGYIKISSDFRVLDVQIDDSDYDVLGCFNKADKATINGIIKQYIGLRIWGGRDESKAIAISTKNTTHVIRCGCKG